MGVSVDSFPLLSFEQANPFLSGIQSGQNIYQQGVQNKFLNPVLQQQLQQAILQNQQTGIQNQYLPAGLQAQINAQRAMPGYYGALSNEANARGGYFGAEANLLNQTTPYLVQQDQGKVYTDPILARLYQLQLAQRTGAISDQLLNSAGIGGNQNIPLGKNNSQNQAQQLATGSYGNASSANVPRGTITTANGIKLTPQQAQTLNAVKQAMAQQSSAQAPASAQGMPISSAISTPGMPGMNGVGTNPLQNFAIFGSPYNPLQMAQLNALGKSYETQATSGITEYNKAQDAAAQSANLGTQLSQLTTQFQNGYKNSEYKGGVLGTMPTTGLLSVPGRLIKGGDLSAEQQTDNASQNMAALVAKLIAGGRVTNYEMQYVANLKPNRAMDPQAAKMVSDFLQQKALRMKEEQDFLNSARQQGVSVQNANSLWQNYNNQRPVYDFNQKKPNTQFQNSWQPYLSPQAVSAVQNGQNYVPMPTFSSKSGFQNWYKTLNPSDQATVKYELGRQQ